METENNWEEATTVCTHAPYILYIFSLIKARQALVSPQVRPLLPFNLCISPWIPIRSLFISHFLSFLPRLSPSLYSPISQLVPETAAATANASHSSPAVAAVACSTLHYYIPSETLQIAEFHSASTFFPRSVPPVMVSVDILLV